MYSWFYFLVPILQRALVHITKTFLDSCSGDPSSECPHSTSNLFSEIENSASSNVKGKLTFFSIRLSFTIEIGVSSEQWPLTLLMLSDS